MKLSLKTKIGLFLVPLLALLLLSSYEGARYWWYRGHSVGERTGIVRKTSVKGPPYCKYFAGELVLTGATAGQTTELWEFSVDDKNGPIVKQLEDAEKSGTRVTLRYRQDLGSLFRCTPSEYFVTAVER